MLRLIVQGLLGLLFAFWTTQAWAVKPEVVELEEEPASKSSRSKKKKRRAKPRREVETIVIEVPDEDEEEEEEPRPRRSRRRAEPPPSREEVVKPGGLECAPAVSEVEIRRPIPIACGVTRGGVSKVEVRYKAPGKNKFTRLLLEKTGEEWIGEIPCALTAERGELKVQFNARGAGDRLIARIDTVTIRLVDSTTEPPPSLPGREPPMRCYDAAECPAEFRGTPTCPGTKAPKGGAKSWGASCESSSECQSGLACIHGTCEQPPKCDITADCPEGSECNDGVCEYLDPEEAASRLEPRYNWIGIHFGLDAALVPKAVGVCGDEGEDRKGYACFQGGDPYEGPANRTFAGNVNSGFRMATMRALLSFDHWFGRVGAGARVGFAFGGPPKDFTALHLEARLFYALRKDPLRKRGRPYLGLVGGYARTDAKSALRIIDCSESNDACVDATRTELQTTPDLFPGVRELEVDAYRKSSSLFFGPTLGYIYALSDGHALQLNLNVMFPDVVFEPSIGYTIGL